MVSERRPPWGERLLSELTASDARAIALAKDLSLDQLNWKPEPGRWSIGQCLEHLAISNEVYGAAISSVLTGAPAGRADEITPGYFSRMFIRDYAAPSDQPLKKKAPPKIRVVADVDVNILQRFLDTNQKSRELVERAAGSDVNRVRFKNPFVFWISFTVGTGLEILSKHEQRHLQQAERVRTCPGFPSA